MNTTKPTKPIDYRRILLRTIDKLQRTGAYYAHHSAVHKRRAELLEDDDPKAAAAAKARGETLARCAADMKFAFNRATQCLTPEDILEIWNEQKQQPDRAAA